MAMRNQPNSVAMKKNRPNRKMLQELAVVPSPKVMSFMTLAAPKVLMIKPKVAHTASLLFSGT